METLKMIFGVGFIAILAMLLIDSSEQFGSFDVSWPPNLPTNSTPNALVITTILPTPEATQPPPPVPALPTLAPTPTRRIEQPQPQTASDETFNCMPITDLQVFLECHFYLPPGCEVRAMSKYAGGPLVFTAEDARARWGPEQPYNGWMVINGINETWLSNCHLTQIQRDRDLGLGQ